MTDPIVTLIGGEESTSIQRQQCRRASWVARPDQRVRRLTGTLPLVGRSLWFAMAADHRPPACREREEDMIKIKHVMQEMLEQLAGEPIQ